MTEPLPSAPKQARAELTRQRILAAAMRALEERGFAGTTTTVVAREAGVSQGALFKHFPSKSLLLASTAQHVYGAAVARYEHELTQALERGEDRIQTAVQLLWRAFTSKEVSALYELLVAARTDEALRRAVAPVLRQHHENIHLAARLFFPTAAARPEFSELLGGVLMSMQGAALIALALPDSDPSAQLAFIERVIANEIRALEGVDT